MKTSLDHLPDAKRRELARVVEILFAEFEAAIAAGTSTHKRQGQILKVVLFGSYARGDWVNDPVGGYVSDYDLLVVVNDEKLTDVLEFWAKADDHLLREYAFAHRITAPANFIVHSLADVNKRLRQGRYFFTDILKDGIALYEAPGHLFERPKVLEPAEALAEAQGYFDEGLSSAKYAVQRAQNSIADNEPKYAAFDLHQATERLYASLLLVLTLYSPKSHRLNFLRSQGEQLDMRLTAAWPRESKFEQRSFELLRRAYVDARYSPHYKISSEELAWLSERISVLHDLVKAICEERLAVLRSAP
ncbi:HEPN domain-containing protein [Phenylobacterium sp. Root700]|uniref:HEPN domain-containing protein n=1 Tax=Phenylobacterium sp. Root700 TaxID=1736591 RepID=UPI0006F30650|nr:HEPN domain-containing protein [Phenylobacterium sp. Root700]KRB52845.1 nucleotidyltransferase [Phenylobacterium sp. Root700]